METTGKIIPRQIMQRENELLQERDFQAKEVRPKEVVLLVKEACS